MPVCRQREFTQRELRLPPDLARLGEVRRFAAEAAHLFGFAHAEVQQVKLAVNEAVANAIEHGSPRDHDEVTVRALEEGGALAIQVVDAGSFAPRMFNRGAMRERGRGLAFMDLLMDEVEVRPSHTGTVVRLLKRPDR